MSGIFNAAIFNNTIFNVGDVGVVVADVVKTGTGGIDRRRIVKPTGILGLPKKKGGNKQVEARLQEAHDSRAEIAAKLAREFSEETASINEAQQIVEMTMAEVDAEIAMLLRKKLRTEEDEVMLLLMMAAVTA